MTVFDRVKSLANSQGVSISRLEEDLGFGKNSLYSWKTKTPNGDRLAKVADYFHVSTDYLLGRDDPEQQPVDLADMDALVTYQGKDIPEQDRELINDLLKRLQG